MSDTTNLGEGSIPSLLAKLAIPAVVAQVVNLLYNIVDRIYIGHIPEIGASALTGVGLFTPILMLINAFAMLAGSGGAPRAAIYMGKKDNNTAEKIVGNCFSFLMICAVFLTAVFYITAPKLLVLFGASSVTLSYAVSYARIYVLGSVFVLIVLGMNLFITTQGFAKISMLTTVIGAVINIILDPVFIFVLGMGVSGAALATVISQAVGAVWILRFLTGDKTILKLKMCNLRLKADIIGPCLALGISSFVMMSTESILSISFTSSLSKFGGDVAVGAMTIITSTSQLILMPVQGICQGGQPIISFNYGANKNDRVKKAFFTQFKVCIIFTCVCWIIMMLFPQILAKKVDFFSIGTNDLTQYTLAVDRQNSKLDAFFDPHHPAVLKMIKMVVDNAHKAGIWAGICGELGADTSLTREFLKMGVDELSVSPGRVLPIRQIILDTDVSKL